MLTVLWNQVLQRASLQSADQDLNTACAIYQSLRVVLVQKLRPTYAAVECDGSGSQPDGAMTAADMFRVSAFTVIIDSLVAALQKRSQAYEGISARFGFLRN